MEENQETLQLVLENNERTETETLIDKLRNDFVRSGDSAQTITNVNNNISVLCCPNRSTEADASTSLNFLRTQSFSSNSSTSCTNDVKSNSKSKSKIRKTYLTGLVLLIIGLILNWIVFTQFENGFGDVLNCFGLAFIISGALILLIAICHYYWHWYEKSFSDTSTRIHEFQEDYINSRLYCDVQIINIPTSLLLNSKIKSESLKIKPPPDYEFAISCSNSNSNYKDSCHVDKTPPPSYNEAVKMNSHVPILQNSSLPADGENENISIAISNNNNNGTGCQNLIMDSNNGNNGEKKPIVCLCNNVQDNATTISCPTQVLSNENTFSISKPLSIDNCNLINDNIRDLDV